MPISKTSKSTHLSPRFFRCIIPWIISAVWVCLFVLAVAPTQAQGPDPLDPIPIWFSGSTETATGIAWGDVDGDGDLDLAVANGGDAAAEPTRVYLNQNGILQTTVDDHWVSNEQDYSWSIAWGDADNDGDLDLAVGNASSPNRVYLNKGGVLEADANWNAPIAGDTRSVAWGDIDGDGRLDLAVGNNGQPNRVYRNEGLDAQGNLQLTLIWTDNITDASLSVAWGDMNGDGKLDLAVGNEGGPNKVYRNLGTILETNDDNPWNSGDNDDTQSVAWGDMNGDGKLDLAVGNLALNNGICCSPRENKVYLNLNSVLQTKADNPWTSDDARVTMAVAWGDVDSDGDLDLIAGNWFSDHQIYLNQNQVLATTGIGGIGGANDDLGGVAWGDVDGDGDLDLAMAAKGAPSKVYQNLKTGLQTAADNPTLFGNNKTTWEVAWGDVDNDGDLDLAVGNGNADYESSAGQPNEIYLNEKGQLQSTPAWTDAIDDPTNSIAWGDVDGDGDLDLAVGNGLVFTFTNRGRPNKVYRNDGLDGQGNPQLSLLWTANLSDTTTSVAWGDVDGDGDLDLAVGNEDEENRIYLNQGGDLQTAPGTVWTSGDDDSTQSVAWGDVDNDGDLDLAVGNRNEENKVYRNDGLSGDTVQLTLFWSSGDDDTTQSVAWGDVDDDGDLDLAAGNERGPSKLYLNQGGQLQTAADNPWLSKDGESTFEVTWGDVDGDGDLDLAAANRFDGNSKVYLNKNGILQITDSWIDGTRDDSVAAAWGDVDGDGDLDLAIGNLGNGGENKVYLNRRPVHPPYAKQSPAISLTVAPAPADFYAQPTISEDQTVAIAYNLFHPNSEPAREIRAFYSPDGGGRWLPAVPAAGTRTTMLGTGPYPTVTTDNTHIFNWDVYNSDFFGQSDNVVFRLEALPVLSATVNGVPGPFQRPYVSAQTFPFRVRGNQVRVFSGTVQAGNEVADAMIYRLPEGRTAGAEPYAGNDGTPFVTDAHGYLQGRGQLAQGDQLIALMPLSDGSVSDAEAICVTYFSSDVPQTISDSGTPSVHSTLDVVGFGVISDVNVVALTGTHTYVGDLDFVLESPAGTSVKIMDQSCGSDDDFYLSLDDEASGGPVGSTCPPTDGGTHTPSNPLSAFAGQESSGSWKLTVNDNADYDGGSLNGWGLEICMLNKPKYTVYFTNATPTGTGLKAHTVMTPGLQNLIVSAGNPLILFDLDVSLEWDARKDIAFLDQLHFDLERTSDVLYDATNGQVALGDITIYHDQEQWFQADIRVYAANNLRPNAAIGGVRTDVYTEVIESNPYYPVTGPYTLTYGPGLIRMGSAWNRFAEASGTVGEDWPRILAHEMGHYLFYLYEDYLQLDADGLLIPASDCDGSLMSNPYREDSSEFLNVSNWPPGCQNALNAQKTGLSDWEVITKFYKWLKAEPANPGPSNFPLAHPQISESALDTPPTTLDVPIIYTNIEGASYQPGNSVQAILYQGDYLIDLGEPSLSKIRSWGANIGDRICLHELDAGRSGCEIISEGDDQLDLVDQPGWRPDLIVTPINSRTVGISLTVVVPENVDLQGRLYPFNDAATDAITLTQTAGTIAVNGAITRTFSGTFILNIPAAEGYIQVWVREDEPRREIVTNYALSGNPGGPVGFGPIGFGPIGFGPIGFGPIGFGPIGFAPTTSTDGQVILHSEVEFEAGQFYALQKATTLPKPPPWATVVGDGYWLVASPNAPDFTGSSLNFRYPGKEVPPGEEAFLRLYRWNGQEWTALPTILNTEINEATAATPGPGLYALMSSIEIPLTNIGWNLIAYPIQETRPVSEALLSIENDYELVYGYDANDPDDPWRIYCNCLNEPAWISAFNDLAALEFGHGYWISTTVTTTLALRGASYSTTNRAVTNFQSPPATYYGPVDSSLAGTGGVTVTAWIGNNRCGTGETIDVAGQPWFVIKVLSNGPEPAAGCGETGEQVTFSVAGVSAAPTVNWQNDKVQYVSLTATTERETKVYLPLILKQAAPFIDLVITQFILEPAGPNEDQPVTVQVTVQNQGTEGSGPFWIDLYINPDPIPSQANQIWNDLCTNPCLGIAWPVGGLGPGQALTLNAEEASALHTIWPGTLPAGTHDLYVYVDSWNPGSATGAVLEANELNNRTALLRITVGGIVSDDGEPHPSPSLPSRPAP